ncbi:hypothetical protein V6N12_034409 [Hibiscus sabdariffa]|uniref:Uncharacterized protein n=1 Tax=Hibiscus sabdariffa TaxID=183260 RepID=A0ABR2DH29_9ROSI
MVRGFNLQMDVSKKSEEDFKPSADPLDQDKLHIVIEEKSERIIKEFPKEGGGKMTREEQSVELDTLQWKEEDNKDTKDSDYSPMEDGVQQALRV